MKTSKAKLLIQLGDEANHLECPLVYSELRNISPRIPNCDERKEAFRDRLFFADIHGSVLYSLDLRGWKPGKRLDEPEARLRETRFEAPLGGFAAGEFGNSFAVAQGRRIVHWNLEKNVASDFVPDIEPSAKLRFNELRVHPSGIYALWSTMDLDCENPIASLYAIDSNGFTKPLLRGLTIGNGMVFDEKGDELFLIDSPTRKIRRFGFDMDPALEDRGVFFEFTEDVLGKPLVPDCPVVVPDGMTRCDRFLYVALFNGGRVAVIDRSSGELAEMIHVPAPVVTSCCFGGPNFDVLFITTSREPLDKKKHADLWKRSAAVYYVHFPRRKGVRPTPIRMGRDYPQSHGGAY